MSKTFVTKRKTFTAIIAVGVAVVLLLAGTFAWQSISQTALNEVSAVVNPGGRLHDDFVDITYDENGDKKFDTMTLNKDVYVENFTDLASNGVQVFARVRLDEYMELGKGAGVLNPDGTASDQNKAVSLIPGATLEDKSTWTPHIHGKDDAFHDYWIWDLEGQTTYMPTFNKNKDSLEADINGTFTDNFASYVDYSDPSYETDGKKAIAIYDADAAAENEKEVDELVTVAGISANDVINGTITLSDEWDKYIERVEETHYARETIDGRVMTMAEYLETLANYPEWDGTGDFWVWDTDGWAYWANPIDPDTATGLLLDQIQRTDVIINQDWYYAINVVAQFVTGDDLGQADNSGFYDLTEGTAPSANALQLLNNIGVDVNFEVKDEAGLIAALENGGTVTLTDSFNITAPLTVTKDTVLNLNDNELVAEKGLWDEGAKKWSMISVVGEDVTLTIEGDNTSKLEAFKDDSFCVDVRDGAKVIINGGTFEGNISAVYVHSGEAVINGGTFSIQQKDATNPYRYVLNCLNENYKNGTAKITVTGGTFVNFDPADPNAGDDGSFVPHGYTSTGVGDGGNTVYTVSKTTVNN